MFMCYLAGAQEIRLSAKPQWLQDAINEYTTSIDFSITSLYRYTCICKQAHIILCNIKIFALDMTGWNGGV